ncbi:MAG: hypothetical protein NW220_15825 [Leptolyngbyaceae cyanobacterium bins.349]|nr:hypothetical protein [Leptolyngbyaceae cyanobacterium bins.349]
MVGAVVERTTSVTESVVEGQNIASQAQTYSTAGESTPSRSTRSEYFSYLSDPDSLIHRYFLSSSPKQRMHLRKAIASVINRYNSILKILDFSRQGDIKDAYDAGVDLLAEFDTLELHNQAFQYLEAISHLVGQSSSQKTRRQLEDFWEILTKGISCAYNVSAKERFELIGKISGVSKRRLVKTAVIDALVTIADDMEDVQPIKNFLGRYTSEYESDSYVRDYAQEALEDLK